LRLPRAWAAAVTFTSQFVTNSNQTSGPSVTLVPNQGAIVTFGLPRPESGARISGEIHFNWTLYQAPTSANPESYEAQFQPVEGGVEEEDKPEDILAAIEARMTPEQRAVYDLRMQELDEDASYDSIVLEKESIIPLLPPQQPQVEAVHDYVKEKR